MQSLLCHCFWRSKDEGCFLGPSKEHEVTGCTVLGGDLLVLNFSLTSQRKSLAPVLAGEGSRAGAKDTAG